MTHYYRYWLVLHPDIKRPIGGVKQMHRLAEALNQLDREATIIQDSASFHPGWFESNVNTISKSDFRNLGNLSDDRDIMIMPETYIATLPKYMPGIPKIIFNQNGSYSFGLESERGFAKPEKIIKLYSHPDLKHVICVSRHDEILLKNGFSQSNERVSRIINSIETTLFLPGKQKSKIISYMPRKNTKDAAIVTELIRQREWFHKTGWSIQAINGLPQDKVAEQLQKSLMFLSFGHPEGFGLPLAEAASCGCYIIGYSGLGGREIFKLASENKAGKEVAYGDWLAFVKAAEKLDKLIESSPSIVAKRLLKNSKDIRQIYSNEEMMKSIYTAMNRWERQIQ